MDKIGSPNLGPTLGSSPESLRAWGLEAWPVRLQRLELCCKVDLMVPQYGHLFEILGNP